MHALITNADQEVVVVLESVSRGAHGAVRVSYSNKQSFNIKATRKDLNKCCSKRTTPGRLCPKTFMSASRRAFRMVHALIKNWNGDGTLYEGIVLPGRTVFPDWMANDERLGQLCAPVHRRSVAAVLHYLAKRKHYALFDHGDVRGAASLSSPYLYPSYDFNITRHTDG
ncbi:hypothetical protein K437DRAFT_266091 [Tilletiaria anomala UBC 951]|uniref:Uncharacterized protein n=1 Tax=Tilletiaria anomala (strain ATCC 24038 / CBS 436.72 / UBC 951) TaxID=1037660 RepID=A0A066WQ78_TILAU|nr:uncharacterized protein K437DRAFT_266091 [Tilletiaria anomala UBC 951]KDN53164.1 hypothetical protein K437DRAFT_266091 [Tilletiaria anomala UBC 951]